MTVFYNDVLLHHSEEDIAATLPLALEIFNKVTRVDGSFFGINGKDFILQFYYNPQGWMVDIPKPKENGSYSKALSEKEITDLIDTTFKYQKLPAIQDLQFSNW